VADCYVYSGVQKCWVLDNFRGVKGASGRLKDKSTGKIDKVLVADINERER